MNQAKTVRASAPGKLFLIGEYAVLEGAPALLTAVDRRAFVTLTVPKDNQWRLSAPNLGIHELALGPNGARADADPALDDRLRVFNAVRSRVAAALDRPLPALAAHIDTAAFARGGHKLGLGSSAAVAAALARALLAWVDCEPSLAELTALAIAAHRDAQNGTGSGGDVATSVYGGMLSYTQGQPPCPLNWPPGLVGRVAVTGTGARTADLVDRVHAYRRRSPAQFDVDMGNLCALAKTAAEQLGAAADFLTAARDYFAALTILDEHAGAGIVSDRHRQLGAVAARHDAVFKSSGAGGGDVGLLFSSASVDQNALCRDFEAIGADLITLGIGAPGVRLD